MTTWSWAMVAALLVVGFVLLVLVLVAGGFVEWMGDAP
jgi:hypothetical protein